MTPAVPTIPVTTVMEANISDSQSPAVSTTDHKIRGISQDGTRFFKENIDSSSELLSDISAEGAKVRLLKDRKIEKWKTVAFTATACFVGTVVCAALCALCILGIAASIVAPGLFLPFLAGCFLSAGAVATLAGTVGLGYGTGCSVVEMCGGSAGRREAARDRKIEQAHERILDNQKELGRLVVQNIADVNTELRKLKRLKFVITKALQNELNSKSDGSRNFKAEQWARDIDSLNGQIHRIETDVNYLKGLVRNEG